MCHIFLTSFLLSPPAIIKIMELDCRKIPNHLRKFRKQMGLTQLEVASLLDITSAKRIVLWEQGKAHPGMLNLFKLSIIYHTFPHELYPECYHYLKESLLPQTEDILLNKHFS
jgi:transcriptional regulator with XRE-family HTH domain